MPIVNFNIPSPTKHIILPIGEQVAVDVLKTLGVYELFENSLYINSTLESSSRFKDKQGKPKLSDNRCDVKVTPNYKPRDEKFGTDTTKGSETNRIIGRDVFHYGIHNSRYTKPSALVEDSVSNITINEMQVPCTIKLDFTLKAKSVELMDQIMEFYSQQYNENDIYKTHQVQYFYTIPDKTLLFLHTLFKLKDVSLDPPTINFAEYCKSISNGEIISKVNRDDPSKLAIGFQRSNLTITGLMDGELGEYEVEKVDQVVDRFVYNFSYVVVFGRPNMLHMRYPIAVDNKSIPDTLISTYEKDEYLKDKNVSSANSLFTTSRVPSIQPLIMFYPFTQLPIEDDWRNFTMYYRSFEKLWFPRLTALMKVDDNGIATSNLIEDAAPLMGEATALVFEESLKMTTPEDFANGRALFQPMYFNNDHVVSDTKITLDDNWNFSASGMNKSSMVRLCIVMNRDVTRLSRQHLDLVFKYADYFSPYIFKNLPWLVNNNYLRVVSHEDDDYYDIVKGKGPTKGKEFGKRSKFTFRIFNYILESTRR